MSGTTYPTEFVSTFGTYDAHIGTPGGDGQSIAGSYADLDLDGLDSSEENPIVADLTAGSGGDGAGDATGAGGAGGSASVTMAAVTLGSAAAPYDGTSVLELEAQGGDGGDGEGSFGVLAGDGGDATAELTGLQDNGTAGSNVYLEATAGATGQGYYGDAGNATASLSHSTMTDAVYVSVAVAANGGANNSTVGGTGEVASASITDSVFTAPEVDIDASLDDGSGIELNSDTFQVAANNNLSFQFISVSESNGERNTAPYVLTMENDKFIGGGTSSLVLQAANLVFDTVNGDISSDSLASVSNNSMSGFNTFYCGPNDSFVVGTGDYTVYFDDAERSHDVLVYTPQSNDVLVYDFFVGRADAILHMRGFGLSLTAQDLAADTVVTNGNTVITVPGAGTITLVGVTTPIPTGEIELDTTPTLAAPTGAALTQGEPGTIAGVSVSEVTTTPGETFTATVSDSTGFLSATGPGVSGDLTRTLVISGSLAQVNGALATLSDLEGAPYYPDNIAIDVTDSNGGAAVQTSFAVAVAASTTQLPTESSSPVLLISGTETLGGEVLHGYLLQLEGTDASAAIPTIDVNNGTITQNAEILVGDTSGTAHYGVIDVAGYAENHGTVEAEGAGSKLTLNVANATDSDGNFVHQGVFNNLGAVAALDDGTILITGDAGSKLINSGTIAASGMVFINEQVTGAGAMIVNSGGSLELGGAVSTGQSIVQNAGGALAIDDLAGFFATIDETAAGGRITLGASRPDSFAYANGRLDLYDAGADIGALHFHHANGTSLGLASFQLSQATATTQAYLEVTPSTI